MKVLITIVGVVNRRNLNRAVVFHEKTLSQRDPNRDNNKVAASKVPQFEVLGFLNAPAVPFELLVQPPTTHCLAPALAPEGTALPTYMGGMG